VSEVINEKKAELLEQRYRYPTGPLFAKLREGPMKFANQKDLKDEFDAHLLALLGEKTAADLEKPKKVRCTILLHGD
jgi:glutaminyl-tRNA synthetase